MHNSSCTCNNYSMIISILSELITVAEFSFGVDTVDAQEFEFHSSVPTVVCNECYIYTMETEAAHAVMNQVCTHACGMHIQVLTL